jgi:hemolysin activation/secretion protein
MCIRDSNNGYNLAVVTVDARRLLDNKQLRFVINEGHLEGIEIEGSVPAYHAYIESIKRRLLEKKPFNVFTLEEEMMRLNEFEGVKAGSLLYRGDLGIILRLILDYDDTPTGSLSVDNRGNRFNGPWQVSPAATLIGVIDPFDSLSLSMQQTTQRREARAASLMHKYWLNSEGLQLQTRLLKIWSQPGFTLSDANIKLQTQGFTIVLNQALMKSRDESLSVSAQFDWRDSRGKLSGIEFSRDKTRVLDLGARYDWFGFLGGSTALNMNLRQSLEAFGARKSGSLNLSRENGKADSTLVRGSVSYLRPIVPSLTLSVLGQGQYAFSQLLAGEEFGFGGLSMGRGYDVSEITGDHGLAGMIEVFHDTDVSGGYLDNVQLYTSYDYGAVWRIDSNNSEARRTASSWAMGGRGTLSEGKFSYDIQLAAPLTRGIGAFSSESAKPLRLFVSLAARF